MKTAEGIEIELNPRRVRVYDRMRSCLVPARRDRSRSELGDVALLLPDLTVLLARLLRDDRVAIGNKALALFGLGYVLSPIDLVPAVIFGPVGWVDDLLVVTATLSRLLNHVHPDVVRSHWSGQGDALEAIQRASAWSERQLGGRLGEALKRFVPGR